MAQSLAAGAGIELPETLALWALAGGRPTRARPRRSAEPAWALGATLERRLTPAERRRGAHYSPPALADRIAALALAPRRRPAAPTVCDPGCGAGSLLLAAASRLAAEGLDPGRIARELIHGADVEPLAVAVSEAALALWSGGVTPGEGHFVVADLFAGADPDAAWPAGGFDVVVGNPPFQAQTARRTLRRAEVTEGARARFGSAAAGLVDTAGLFMLASLDLVRDGGTLAMVQPASVAAARDAEGVRTALSERARVVELWAPEGRLFEAAVHVCVPVLEVGRPGSADWARHVARARGVPAFRPRSTTELAEVARAVAGFRDEYYGLAPFVRDLGGGDVPPKGGEWSADEGPLVTSGAIDLGRLHWGERPVRFARQSWVRPVVDRRGALSAGGRTGALLARVGAPKAMVATQTRIVEVAVDDTGHCVPCTPVISVLPLSPGGPGPWELAAALAAPPAVAWLAERTAGTGLHPGSLRPTAPLLGRMPLPVDEAGWVEATEALRAGDLDGFGRAATAAHALPAATERRVLAWWTGRLPATAGRGRGRSDVQAPDAGWRGSGRAR